MSTPKLPEPDPTLTREQTLNMILASIAMEEAALSRLIDAEACKVCCLTNCADCCRRESALIEVNRSVASVVEMAMQMQLILKGKMEKVLEALPPHPVPCGCRGPHPCCGRPEPCPCRACGRRP